MNLIVFVCCFFTKTFVTFRWGILFSFENVNQDSNKSVAIWAVDTNQFKESSVSFLERCHDEFF